MPETNTTIPPEAQRALTELKADILDAADDVLLDAYALGRAAGSAEQQATFDATRNGYARSLNHLAGLLRAQDAQLTRAWDLGLLQTQELADAKERIAALEHDLRVSQANHATDRERLDTEIRNHQKTRGEMVAAHEAPQPRTTVGGERPAHRPGEVVYVHTTGAGGYLQIKGDTPANNRRLNNLRPWDIAAVEFPAGHIVWASSPAILGEVRRLFHSK